MEIALRPLIACLAAASAAVLLSVALPAWAQAQTQAQAQAVPQDATLKEVEVAASAFVRGAPVPAWAELLPMPAPGPADVRKPVVVRLADNHLWAGEVPAHLSSRADQVNDAAALGHIGQVALPFNPQYQRLLLHKLAILRGGQSIDHTAQAQVRFLQRETGLEQGIYSGVVTASLLLSDVRVGDTLHLVYTVEGENPVFGQRYSGWASWEHQQPVNRRRVTLVSPESRQIRWQWMGETHSRGSRPEQVVRAGQRILRFDESDVAGVDVEPAMPPQAQPMRWLLFSEYASWAEVAQWAVPLFPADAPLPAALQPVMQRLKALPTADEKASAALQWVQGEIRYWSVSLGESSHRPHLPEETVARRFGDCKDKSLLLTRMLVELGLQARPALASLRSRSGPKDWLPTPLAFDHVVVQLQLGGREYTLDPTRLEQVGALATMGQHLEEAQLLPVAAGSQALVEVRSPNRSEIFTGALNETFRLARFDGEAELEVQHRWAGLGAESLRLALPRLDAAQLERWSMQGYERRYPGIKLQGAPRFEDDRSRNLVVATVKYKVPGFARQVDGDWVARYFPANFAGALHLPEQLTRKFPVVVPSYPGTLHYLLEVHWPDSVAAVTDPRMQRQETPHFELESTRSFRGNVARHALKLVARVPQVPAAELPRLVEDLRTLDQRVGGVAVVDKSQIKAGGLLGIGRETLQDKLRKTLQEQVDRTGRQLREGKLAGADLANGLCSRAEALADLGRPAEGLKDALEAVKVSQQSGRAHQCLANLHFISGDFARAAAQYTRALPLSDDTFDAYYRRGHARFYEGKLELAAEDFAKAAADKEDESDRLFAQLWQVWTLQLLQRPLPAELDAAARKQPRGAWPRPALAMLVGELTPEQMLAHLRGTLKGDELEMALAEAWFYVGQYHRVRGQAEPARQAFEQAREKNIIVYIEHVSAGFELARLAR